jgi:parallel beta-helix repeat protein
MNVSSEVKMTRYSFILAFALTLIATYTASAAVIYVPDNYGAIQSAINSAENGDTIIVRDGTYYENLLINKSIQLRSENGSTRTIISGDWNSTIVVSTHNVVIEGFTIQNGWRGIYILEGYLNVTIANNTISNNNDGIYARGSSNNTIANNTISNNNDGIDAGLNNTIANNTISNNKYYGIYVYYLFSNNIIANNIISNNFMAFMHGKVQTT